MAVDGVTAVHLTLLRTDPGTGDVVVNARTDGSYTVVPLVPRVGNPADGYALVVGDGVVGSVLDLGDHAAVLTAQRRSALTARLGVAIPAGTTAGQAIIEVLIQGDDGTGPGARWRRMPSNRPNGGWLLRLGPLTLERAA